MKSPVRYNTIRYHSDGRILPYPDQVITGGHDFVRRMIHAELLHGAKIQQVTDTNIVLMTNVLGSIDHTSFSVSFLTPEFSVMREIASIAAAYNGNGFITANERGFDPHCWSWLQNNAKRTHGAVFITMTGLGFAISPETNLGDLLAALELYLDGISVEEINTLLHQFSGASSNDAAE